MVLRLDYHRRRRLELGGDFEYIRYGNHHGFLRPIRQTTWMLMWTVVFVSSPAHVCTLSTVWS
jgi:hypothetical protein